MKKLWDSYASAWSMKDGEVRRTSKEFVGHIADILEPLGEVSVSRFFSGHQIRVNDEQIAIVMKGDLYFRASERLQPELEQAGGRPFS